MFASLYLEIKAILQNLYFRNYSNQDLAYIFDLWKISIGLTLFRKLLLTSDRKLLTITLV